MDYKKLQNCLYNFKNLKTKIIGRSEDNRNIYSVSAFFHCNRPWVIFHGAIHAREHLTTDLVITLAEIVDNKFEHFKSKKNFPNICFVPMINPDGVEIAIFGTKIIKNVHKKRKMEQIIAFNDYKLIKSNVNGVDLNNNFDAFWGRHINSTKPSLSGFIGQKPFSEKESIVLKKLTERLMPIFTVSYHMKGEEIYYDFYQKQEYKKRDKKIAEMISVLTGYKIKSTEKTSSGGYKDWCISKFSIPSLTIEVGRDCFEHPVPDNEVYNIIAKNAGIIDLLCDIVCVIQGD